jgi:lipoprotein-anchoring transpeptidase ErfK/SrfK
MIRMVHMDRRPTMASRCRSANPEREGAGQSSSPHAHTLVYTTPQGEQLAYPIAVGRQGKRWYGTTHVTSKRKYPEWRPTASMRQKNPRLPMVVRPGPSNPLGTRAIYLADGLLRIHGTNDPSSIGTNASSGCFRMYREDVEELYEMVRPGTRVIVRR